MRIGLSGAGDLARVGRQSAAAQAEGFSSLWFAGAIGTDPLIAITVAGREPGAETIELGTSIVQTYTRHPTLLAQQAAAVAQAVGGERFTLGIGVSHQPVVEGVYGMAYERTAAHLREYLGILVPLLRGKAVDVDGEHFSAHTAPRGPGVAVPVLVAALGPLMLRAAGELADGTITWMANRRAVAEHVAPRLAEAATAAGRPAPRVVVGLPVAVCSDAAEGREAAAEQFRIYGALPNYQRILAAGGVDGPAGAAIVGGEEAVAGEVAALFEAGATDVWAAIFPVGDDRSASRARTRSLLAELARTPVAAS